MNRIDDVIYCVDTSSMVRAWHEAYAIDVFPTFWDNIEELIDDGRFIAPDEVFRETKRRDDDLHKWFKKRKECFVAIDDDLQDAVSGVMAEFQFLVKNRPGKNAADPWVIALAMVNEATVVTEESYDNSKKYPKIPQVCQHYGIDYINVLELARKEGWRF